MSTWSILSKIVASVLIVATTVTASAQQAPALSKKALSIKHKIDGLAPHSRISVIPVHGEEAFGEYLSNNQDEFTFHDVDSKIDLTLKYSEVRKVKNGYGGFNHVAGRHVDRTKNLIFAIAVLGGLGVLIVAVAATKD
jgi:hypothetical protein